MTPSLFLCKIDGVDTTQMDKEKLKLLVRNLELLVDSLKAEVYSDAQSYLNYEEVKTGLHDYDEIFDDDDGYPD